MQACTRCGSELGYAGRPCALCLSPATFRLEDGAVREIAGATRAERARLPEFALPPHLRGKKIRAPRGRRAIRTLTLVGRWTWNSLAIASIVHVLVFLLAFLFRDELHVALERVQQLSLEREAAAPIVAPQPDELKVPDLQADATEMQIPREVIKDLAAGDPEYEPPPEHKPYAPEFEVAPVRPAVATPLPRLPARTNSGLGAGQPAPSANEAPSGAGLLQNRRGDSRAAALKRYGGGEDTEQAVNLGLEYLADRQSADGSWDPNRGFEVRPRWATDDNGYRGAITALCTLPFLAAGHSPDEGRYAPNVRRAIQWLLKNQTSDGCISYRGVMQMYAHTVATLALCEAYGMTRDGRLKTAAERAVRFLERTQGTGGGWDYQAVISGPMRGVERNDLSISGWAVLALKSARAVGLGVNDLTLERLGDLYDRHSLDNGETYYADREYGELPATRKGIGMVGVGLTSRVILDPDRFLARNAAAEKLLLAKKPQWIQFLEPSYGPSAPNFHTFYGLYYGTLGIFLKNQGEGPAWEQWNAALKKTLLENQVLKGPRKGSWPAADSWIGPIMGDLYSTACSVLCLEVYYRYNPMHQPETHVTPAPEVAHGDGHPPAPKPEPKPLKPVTIGGVTLDLAKPGDRAKYLRLLGKEQGLAAVPVLVSHLEDESATVRTTALYEVGRLKAKDAVEPVTRMLGRSENRDLRLTICDTLGKLGDKSAAQPLIKLLSDEDPIIVTGASRALVRLSGGKDFGTNRHAWADYFGVNP
ncbi:MAG: HEAT repeat domain-containing protein [Planctomycetes bacterium]|jgi:hypothetical protein|nr:HEAT repeat domain-containing protein [Planctomycetota bacterium]